GVPVRAPGLEQSARPSVAQLRVEHHHGRIGDRDDKPYGNSVLLWFEVHDFEAIIERAKEMGVEIIIPRHRNPPDGNGGPNHWECWIRDPDGYGRVGRWNWRPGQ